MSVEGVTGKGIFPPGTARHGPPSRKRREAYSYRNCPVVWTAEFDAQLMDAISEGLSFTQTGKRLGLSTATVSSRFKRLREAMGEQAM